MGNEGWAGDRSIGCCFAGSCSWSVWVCKVGGGGSRFPAAVLSMKCGEFARLSFFRSLWISKVAANEGCFRSSLLLSVLFIIVSPAFGNSTNVRQRSRVFLKYFFVFSISWKLYLFLLIWATLFAFCRNLFPFGDKQSPQPIGSPVRQFFGLQLGCCYGFVVAKVPYSLSTGRRKTT